MRSSFEIASCASCCSTLQSQSHQMPIVHIQHYRLLSIRFRHSSIQTRGPVAINWPSPLPPASVKYDEDAGLFKLECATTLPGIVIDSGHITVVLEPDFKTALDFQPGTFPPLSSGELYFPRIDISIAASSQYEYCMVRAEFTLAQTGKDYAPSFAGVLDFDLRLLGIAELFPSQLLCNLVSQATSVSTSLELAANSGEMKPFFEKHLPTSKTSSHPVSPNHPASLPKTRNLPPPLIFLPIPSPSPMMRRINISQRRNPWTRNLNPPFLHSRRSPLSTRLGRHTSAFSVGSELDTSSSVLSILPHRPQRNPLPMTLSFPTQLRLLPFLLNLYTA